MISFFTFRGKTINLHKPANDVVNLIDTIPRKKSFTSNLDFIMKSFDGQVFKIELLSLNGSLGMPRLTSNLEGIIKEQDQESVTISTKVGPSDNMYILGIGFPILLLTSAIIDMFRNGIQFVQLIYLLFAIGVYVFCRWYTKLMSYVLQERLTMFLKDSSI